MIASSKGSRLVVISTHPVQYHAPVYREVERLGLPVTAIYGSDFSVAGYQDREFGVSFAWSTDLLSGYSSVFLSTVAGGGARSPAATSPHGLSTALSQIDPTAVLLTGYWPNFLRRAALSVIARRIPALFRAETTDHARVRDRLSESIRNRILRAFYKRCSALLYIGVRSRQHFERLGVDGRELFFSPYCVDSDSFETSESSRTRMRDETRRELGISSGQVALLFSGKLVQRKGPDLLLDAIERLTPERRQRITVVFLGEGELRETLAARSHVAKLAFVGFKNQHELSKYYHSCDALVLPSRSGETWGLVANEALMHGLPCVLSEGVGSSPDLMRHGVTGEVFATNSAESLAQALERLLIWVRDDAELRSNCRRQVAGYSVHAAATGIVSAYEAVAHHTVAVPHIAN